MKIILVEDNSAYRESLKFFLENKLGHAVIWESSSGEEFLAEAPVQIADIIMMDIEMYGINGIEATKKMNILFPSAKIIAVTMHTDKYFLRQLISNGFRGCINKSEIFEKLETALNTVLSGELFFPNDLRISN